MKGFKSGLTVLAILTTVLGFSSTAIAGQTASTRLSVTIAPKTSFCDIPSQTQAQLSGASQSIGVLNICSNQPAFNLAVSSLNGGQLRAANNQTAPGLDYQVSATSAQAVGGGQGLDVVQQAATVKPSTEPTVLYQSPQVLCNAPGQKGCDVGMKWQVTGNTNVPNGVYADTLVYTLSSY